MVEDDLKRRKGKLAFTKALKDSKILIFTIRKLISTRLNEISNSEKRSSILFYGFS